MALYISITYKLMPMVENYKYGIFCGAFKPFHIGHLLMIQKAAKECDRLILVVSLLDRDIIKGSDMALIWKNHILKILPNNVDPIFLESSPIKRVFEILKLRDENKSSPFLFSIYSDKEDSSKYSDQVLSKICPNILGTNALKIIPISRDQTIQISGTKMREFIKNNDFVSFEKYMPKEINSKEIFNILTRNHK
jgi:cytidyltransferase-like protein